MLSFELFVAQTLQLIFLQKYYSFFFALPQKYSLEITLKFPSIQFQVTQQINYNRQPFAFKFSKINLFINNYSQTYRVCHGYGQA